MNEARKVLLIGGGGTLGAYTAEELLRMNCQVDVICLEDNQPARDGLCFYQGRATLDYLSFLLPHLCGSGASYHRKRSHSVRRSSGRGRGLPAE